MRFSVFLLLSVGTLIFTNPARAQPGAVQPGEVQPGGDSPDAGQRSFLRAQTFFAYDQPDSAARYARRALAQWEQQQQWNQYAYGLSWLGNLYRRVQQNDSAFFYLSRALVTVTSSPVQDTTRAQVYDHLGSYYKSVRQPAQAIQMFQKAVAVQKSLDDSFALAGSYNALGNIYRYTYLDYITAQQYYQRALRLLEGSGVENKKKLFDVVYSLATTSRLREDYEQALAYGYRAAELAKTLPDGNQEVCYTMLGNILFDQENNASAIYNYQRALALGVDRLGNNDPALIIRLNNLAGTYIRIDSLEQGVRLLDHALRIYQTSGGQGEDRIASTYDSRGDAYGKIGKTDSATIAYHRSLEINRRIHGPHHPSTTDILATLGTFYFEQASYDSALHYFQQALVATAPEFAPTNALQNPAVRTMMGDPLKFQLLHEKALVLMAEHQRSSSPALLTAALDCFVRADSLMDSCRVLYDREAAKLTFLEVHRQVYEQAVVCSYRLYQSDPDDRYLAWAFHFMEKSKAVVLWEALAESQDRNSVGIPDSLLKQERAIKLALAYVNNELQTAKDSGADSTVTELRAEQFTLARQKENLTLLLQQAYPNYFRIKYGQHNYTLDQARDYTATANTTLVEYLWGEDHLYGLSITPQRVVLTQVSITDSVQQALTTVLSALQQPPRVVQRTEDFERYTQAAYLLYQRCLRPLLDQTKESRSSGLFDSFQEAQQKIHPPALTIIPDGELAYLPFEALITRLPSTAKADYRRLAYVVDTLAVSYAPSAQVLTQRPNHVRNAMRFLAFGYSGSGQDIVKGRWQNLPGTAQEVANLRQMAEGTFYTGKEATEHQFKAEAQNYDVIHLAMHGLADTLHPNNSRLVFRNELDSIDDGYLYAYELYDMQLQADLAVLSACESGTGKLQQGEGVYSLARGFTYAGCPTVVMSLWKVDDRQTSTLIPAFYRELYSGSSVNQALRTAKLQYREQCSSFYAHPAYWAAFVVGGTTTPVMSYGATHRIAALVGLLSVIYLGLALYWRRRAQPKNSLRYTMVEH